MTKVIYGMLVSLDGCVESPQGDIGWTEPDEELHQHFNDFAREAGAFLYGRGLYETMASFWPTADRDPNAPPVIAEYAKIWRATPKVVFSTTLDHVGDNTRLAGNDIVAEVAALKREARGHLEVGGPGLAETFMALDLIDEYHSYIHPVILGGGKRMFSVGGPNLPLRLVETRVFGSGVVLLRHERAR